MVSLSPPFIAAMVAVLMSSRIIFGSLRKTSPSGAFSG